MADAAADTPFPRNPAGPRLSEAADEGPLLAADGTPLKRSLARSLRMQKIRAFLLIAPLLIFVLVTFVAPIIDMLFRSVENQIVSETLPRTTAALSDWDPESDPLPDEDAYAAMAYDLVAAEARKVHTRLGSRLNYETTGISSLFRQAGRRVDDAGEVYLDQFVARDAAWEEPQAWAEMAGSDAWLDARVEALASGTDEDGLPLFEPRASFAALLPETGSAYAEFARLAQIEDGDDPATEEPWAPVYLALYRDLAAADPAEIAAYDGPGAARIAAAARDVPAFETTSAREMFLDMDEDWGDPAVWTTIKTFAPPYTAGYFLAAVDLKLTPEGIAVVDEDQRIYLFLFQRTLWMSLVIMASCVLLGYPVAFLLATLPMRTANVLLILVLLPFWTSLLVRTSAWKVLLQQQGVINDILVWSGLLSDANRLVMINNQIGTIIAMTHILLPFMILPLYSVMKTIPPTYMRAARSLGATDWTAFWRVYFPQSVPGIGAGCILVFILAIGYYITPELVGGTTGTFISNRIAFHISSSLNWGLAAALGTILLVVVLVLYWVYDRIVGIDNVSLG